MGCNPDQSWIGIGILFLQALEDMPTDHPSCGTSIWRVQRELQGGRDPCHQIAQLFKLERTRTQDRSHGTDGDAVTYVKKRPRLKDKRGLTLNHSPEV